MTDSKLNFFLFALACLFTAFMLIDARRNRSKSDEVKVDLQQGEMELARISTLYALSKHYLVLTTNRLVQVKSGWLLASVSTKTIPLKRLDAARMGVRMDFASFIIGAFVYHIYAPAGLAIIVFSICNAVQSIFFASNIHRMTLPVARGDAANTEAHSFVRQTLQQRAVENGGALASDLDSNISPLDNSGVPRDLWIALGILLVAAYLQTKIFGGVDLENPLCLSIFSAIPVWIGVKHGPKSGFLAGFFGMMGVAAVYWPSQLWGYQLVSFEFVPPVYVLAALICGTIGYAGSKANNNTVSLTVLVLAHFLWMVFAMCQQGFDLRSPALWSFGFLSSILIAAAVSTAVAKVVAENTASNEEAVHT